MMSTMQFTFGYGVGGEYPMAAGSAAERAEAKGRASARKRGREVPSLSQPKPTCLFCLNRVLYQSSLHAIVCWIPTGVTQQI